jgi:hypothetical protein
VGIAFKDHRLVYFLEQKYTTIIETGISEKSQGGFWGVGNGQREHPLFV